MAESRLLRYILRRSAELVPLFFLIIIFAFVLIRITPADPVTILAGEHADPAYYELIRKKFGLDRPIHEQLVTYVLVILQGDLGYSYLFQRNVSELVFGRLINTLLLMMGATLIYIPLGVGLGVIASTKPRCKWDNLITSFTLFGYSLPIWWLGVILLLVFSVWLQWFPVVPRIASGNLVQTIGQTISNLTLPSMTLATAYMAFTTRLTRSCMLQTLSKDFVTTAWAKGLGRRRVLIWHALRNTLLPVLSLVFANLGYMFGGAVLTEIIFSWPGIGSLLYGAVMQRDYPVIMGVFVVVSAAVLLINLLTDILYCIVDPRVKYR